MTEDCRETADGGHEFPLQPIITHAKYWLGQSMDDLSFREMFMAVALALRERIVDVMLETQQRYRRTDAKRVYYLSMEFLMGRSLRNNLANLGMWESCERYLNDIGIDLRQLERLEVDAALGNGGLGRLAACFLDSLATLGMPAYGYGINYEYGLFKQGIRDGYQQELPDHWLAYPTPWEIQRPDEVCPVPVYGWVEDRRLASGGYEPQWVGWRLIKGVPHDMPVVGYGGKTVNVLRLYSARASNEFDMEIFNEGDFFAAVEKKVSSENISKVLYPTDMFAAGLELRLVQEYFLCACAVRDIVRRHMRAHPNLDELPRKAAIQLNDTHPALTVAELMRVLVDESDYAWEAAWEITRATLGYTNHTLMPEALEKWSVSLLGRVLPRHLQIIYEINRRFLEEVSSRWPGDVDRVRRMSIIEEGPDKKVRMAHLSVVGSHAVNGVAELHSNLLKTRLLSDFHDMWPERFSNKTNGVTTRRWLMQCNPRLADLITDAIGDEWITDFAAVQELEDWAESPSFQNAFLETKRLNKQKLGERIAGVTGIFISSQSLFDVQIKRIHAYKRQLLSAMHIVHQYLRLIEDGVEPVVPRTFIFAGKAAPGYWLAKQVIKLITSIGEVVNADPRTHGLLRVVFMPDYRVSLAERIIPGADLSEQISTAGMEASGTGNMKLSMNGALTIGTLDGANIEIREEVGEENFYTFGLTIEQVEALRRDGSYDPGAACAADPRLARIVEAIRSPHFCPGSPGLFSWVDRLLFAEGDHYLHMADLPSYLDAQDRVSEDYQDRELWVRKAILNVARMGKFSSDRTIRQYADEIWDLKPVLKAPDAREHRTRHTPVAGDAERRIEEIVSRLVCGRLRCDPELIGANTRFIEDIGADPLEVTELMLVVQEEFGIVVDTQSASVETIADLIRFVEARLYQ